MIPHSFSTQARDQYQKLKIMHSNMVTLYLNMLEFFAIDSKKTSVEELFTDLSNFRAMFMVSRDSDSAHNHSLYIIWNGVVSVPCWNQLVFAVSAALQ